MQLPDFYAVLGIGKDASDMEIKQAFRKKAKDLHPSVNKDPEAADDFLKLHEAYEILIHHNTRSVYEEDLRTHMNPMYNDHYSFWIKRARTEASQYSKMSLDEYTGTKFFKNTQTNPYWIFLIGLIAGIIVLMGPVFLLVVKKDNAVLGVTAFFLSLPVGLFLIIQGMAGINTVKKHTVHHKR